MDADKLRRLKKVLPEVFTDEAETLSTDELKKAILNAALKIERVKEAREADEELNKLEEQAGELRSSYNEIKNVEQARITFCKHLLGERGAD